MRKQIEKGCKAILVRNDNLNGHVVKVIKCAGTKYKNISGEPYMSWSISGVKGIDFSPEENLKRIDGDDQTTWQSIEQLTNWNPEKAEIAGDSGK